MCIKLSSTSLSAKCKWTRPCITTTARTLWLSTNKCIMEGIENIDIKDIKIANQLNLRIKLLDTFAAGGTLMFFPKSLTVKNG